ncbi:PSD1 and planctomycete cytochrome C domain-containing protein [Planctomicrobium sp.]|jgi:hypothetical protein|nr:PSD1 and planctomycete cytochrome C domain-containing protein [Planctomicrobium sp.]MDA7503420.1 PSD1 and planctomycete cytochrome C domain-containing protein [bacterium]MDB4743466.1 PSD1 and planctomycete cytochrome C domain-containing protein [Planctomicrobium sp.]
MTEFWIQRQPASGGRQSPVSTNVFNRYSWNVINLCLFALSFFGFTQLVEGAEPSKETSAETVDQRGIEFFERKIRPLFAERCYQCHAANSKKANGGLLLDSPHGIRKGSDSGPVIVKDDPGSSPLLVLIQSTDENVRMPPDGERLTQSQIADLQTWLNLGAPLPEVSVQEDQIAIQSRTHWAFQPVIEQVIPTVQQNTWVQTPIDAFIISALEQAKLSPAPQADKRILIRRATYDLIGLPPTPEEVAAFIADESPEAFATIVDRLLSSPQYGERWGRHWLDVARFATSDGPFAFTYRDYVIQAFNDDLPFDEFLIHQMAADQLELGDNKRPLAALGFLTVGRKFMDNHDTIDDRIDVVTRGTMGLSVSCARCHDHKYDPIPTKDYYALHGVFASSHAPGEAPLLGIDPDPVLHAEYLQEHHKRQSKLDDFIREQEAAVLTEHRGLTAEYLMLSREPQKIEELIEGVFGLSDRKILQTGARRWLAALNTMNPETDLIFAPWFAYAALPSADFVVGAKSLSAKIANDSFGHPLNSHVAKMFADDPPKSLQEVAERYGKLFQDIDTQWQQLRLKSEQAPNSATIQALPDREQESLRHVYYNNESPGNLPSGLMRGLFPVSVIMQMQALQGPVEQLKASHPGAPLRAMSLVDSPHPHNSRVFIRGDASRPGDEAPRQFLTSLTTGEPQPFTQGSGRLELAQAIASRDNPLTARVMVNRIWQHHFGAGLVTTPDDFGLRSDPPSHPELLDHLAWRFMNDGWSIKKMHRMILLSSVYQQVSDNQHSNETVDPENRLLSKMNRRRLDFEAMRDTLLFVTGEINSTFGGRPVSLKNPEQKDQHLFSNRRTVYGVIDRNSLLPLFGHFDFANPDLTTAQRDITTVPQQSLFFFNDPFVMQQASNLATRADFQLFDTTEQRIQYVYQQLFQRDPTPNEIEIANQFLSTEESSATHAIPPSNSRPLRPWERLVHVLLMSNELMFVD